MALNVNAGTWSGLWGAFVLALGIGAQVATGEELRVSATPDANPALDIRNATMRPRAIVVHVHRQIADQRFVPELTRRLTATLAPPVFLQSTEFNLEPFRRLLEPIDGEAVTGALIASVDWARQAATVQVMLIPDDLRLRPARFNFAVSNGTAATPHHVVIVSLARVQQVGLLERAVDKNPARTSERVFKLIVKNVARVSGYASSNLCLFGFPRNLEELDALPEGFCEPDRGQLVAAGIVKP